MVSSAHLIVLALFQFNAVNGQVTSAWPFGYAGLSKVSLTLQTNVNCNVYFGSTQNSISNSVAKLSWPAPSGEFPIYVSCSGGSMSTSGIRVSLSIDDAPQTIEIWEGAQSSAAAFQNLNSSSCITNTWTISQDQAFQANGGIVSSAASVWPCLPSFASNSWMRAVVRIPATSTTARRLDVAVTADDAVSMANLGPWSFIKPTAHQDVYFFTLFIEPGSYPFWLYVTDGGVRKGLGVALKLDGTLLYSTVDGPAGWTVGASANAMTLQSYQCDIQSLYDIAVNTVLGKMGIRIGLFWYGTSCISSGTSKMFAQRTVDIPPRSNVELFTKYDFALTADNPFYLIMGDHSASISSLLDLVGDPYSGWGSARKFSVWLGAGEYDIDVLAANYGMVSTDPAMFIGAISQSGNLVTETGTAGQWKVSTAGINDGAFGDPFICPFNYWTAPSPEVDIRAADGSVTSNIKYIWAGTCDNNAPRVVRFRYHLSVAGIAAATATRNQAVQVATSTSTPEIKYHEPVVSAGVEEYSWPTLIGAMLVAAILAQ